MLNLIKLELRKFKIAGNILGGFIASFLIMAFVIAVNYDAHEKAFASYKDVLGIIDATTSITFIVFASVLLSKFIIDEYKTRSITVLFMYPLQRKKLLTAKLIIVVLFTFLFGIIGRVIVFSGFYIYNSFAHFIPGELPTSLLVEHGVRFLVNSAMYSCIALIPLYFGMRKYSVPTTIVSSILVAAVLNANNGTEFTLSSIVVIPAAIAAVGLVVAYLAIRNADTKDVV
ncbi:ABC transporter permease [Paenibacillus sanfengchensis]|uniref:ABC transporter permease n=1 Tax=Paenibacillus sanfengchensis TaxID=3119819 RepID=UPI002FE25170